MHIDWNNEVEKLEIVKNKILSDLDDRLKNSENFKEKMRALNKDMWEDVGVLSGHSTMDEAPTFIQDVTLLKQYMITSEDNNKKIKMLEKQLHSPYFSRIDFKEDDYETENIYIGIYGIRDESTSEILVYDWRAPISSIFYDYEPGRVSYKSPSGDIYGDLLLKRQYRIENGKLIIMFDSNIAIEDNILQDILAESSNNKMKTIITTIQREQNRAIRFEGKKVMVVQGPAGSGKTSIALHRAAYLLYRHRDNIRAENILLYTPNGTFSEYISSVLPTLGEEGLKCITLMELTMSHLGNQIRKYESYSEMMEWQLEQKYLEGMQSRIDSIRYKASHQFVNVLDRFIKIFENNVLNFEDIKLGNYVFISKSELDELFQVSFKQMPVAKRLARIKGIVSQRIIEFEKLKRKEKCQELDSEPEYISDSEIKAISRISVSNKLQGVKEYVEAKFSLNILEIYLLLFKNSDIWHSCDGSLTDRSLKVTVDAITNGMLYYEDQGPILYIMSLLGMIDPDRNAKHIIIDEAQDYSVVVFKLFSRLYSDSNITLLGDLNQNINPIYGIGSVKPVGEIIANENYEYIELNKSYRSTLEIMEFAVKILPANFTPFGRNGIKPGIITSNTTKEIGNLITNYLNDMIKDNFKSIAIICRTLADCHKINDILSVTSPINIIETGNEELSTGIVLIPSYFAKGLEFDVVLTVILSENDYMVDEDQLLYTIFTRALHRLDIFAVENANVLKRLR